MLLPFYYVSYNIFYKYIYINIVKFKGFPLVPPVYCLYFLHYITVFYNVSFVKVFCYLCYLCFVIYAFLLFGERGRVDSVLSGSATRAGRGRGVCHPCPSSDTCRGGQRRTKGRAPSLGWILGGCPALLWRLSR